mmetsp:Transcript_6421/g.5518  ORF Transcript_6421/g.5518 Transcript_6421/m.5518 type:complete len:137 (-) Transcript_6421:29-439(-)
MDNSKGDITVKDYMTNEMKKLVVLTFLSSRQNFCKNHKNSSFEIFGFDFIVDEKLKIWLLEVNTNPCFEESSQLLSELLPRMIDDALKLTIDVMFKKSKINLPMINEPANDEEEDVQQTFPVHGYSDDKNLWVHIL